MAYWACNNMHHKCHSILHNQLAFFMNVSKAFPKILIDMRKLIPWESSCFSISPEFFVVWLIYSDEELLAAKRSRLAVNRTFSGRRFAGCLPFFRVGQGGVLEKQEAAAEEAAPAISRLWQQLALELSNTV